MGHPIVEGRALLVYSDDDDDDDDDTVSAATGPYARPADSPSPPPCPSERCRAFNCPGGLHQPGRVTCVNFDSVRGYNSANDDDDNDDNNNDDNNNNNDDNNNNNDNDNDNDSSSNKAPTDTHLSDIWAGLRLDKAADHRFVLNFALSGNPRTPGSSVNGRKMVLATAPVWEHPEEEEDGDGDGGGGGHRECDGCRGCHCTHVLDVPHGKVIELVLANVQGDDQQIYAHHPVHLHGYSFAVLTIVYPTYVAGRGGWQTAHGLRCLDSHCDRVSLDVDYPQRQQHDGDGGGGDGGGGDHPQQQQHDGGDDGGGDHPQQHDGDHPPQKQHDDHPRQKQHDDHHPPQQQQQHDDHPQQHHHYNSIDPPIKDTVLVPSRGYVVVRFVADNPGFWFMHCHVDQHMNDGMALMLNTGGGNLSAPLGFPTCSQQDVSSSSSRVPRLGQLTEEGDGAGGKESVFTLWAVVLIAAGTFLAGVVIAAIGMAVLRCRNNRSARL